VRATRLRVLSDGIRQTPSAASDKRRGAHLLALGCRGLYLSITSRPRAATMNSISFDLAHELRFESLFNPGRALAFPCDAQGHVELDALSERARRNYLYARAVVGREYATPAVTRADNH
jgi:hypothetical protein